MYLMLYNVIVIDISTDETVRVYPFATTYADAEQKAAQLNLDTEKFRYEIVEATAE